MRLWSRLCSYGGVTSQIEWTANCKLYTELNSNMADDLKGGSLTEVLGA